MSRQRLFSSDEIINALLRCGFELTGRRGKNHQTLKRPRADGRHDVTSVPIGQEEIPKGTLDTHTSCGFTPPHEAQSSLP
jgi:predicted RNA binding protein YcfA (HicA-like mRNA interferase family)